MKKSIWISLAAFAIFVAGALAALAVFLSRRDSKLIGDDDYDEYDFDFDDEDAPVEQVSGGIYISVHTLSKRLRPVGAFCK